MWLLVAATDVVTVEQEMKGLDKTITKCKTEEKEKKERIDALKAAIDSNRAEVHNGRASSLGPYVLTEMARKAIRKEIIGQQCFLRKYRHAYRHVYRYVYRHVLRHVFGV